MMKMEEEKSRKDPDLEEPGLEDITAQIKELGARIKEVFVCAAQSETARKLQKQALDGFDLLMEKTGKVAEDIRSGQLEKDAKKNLHQGLQNVNQKLKDYSESAKTDQAKSDKEIEK